MKVKSKVVAATAMVVLGHALPARAQLDTTQQQAQCVLAAMKDTRSPLAVQMIRTACNDMAVFNGPLYQTQRQYDWCLIQNLSGAQSDAAAIQIQGACRTAYPLS